MQKKGSIFLLIVLLNCFVPVSAQTDMFMKVMDPGQINGESTFTQYLNWINIYGYNAGASNTVSFGGAGGAGRANTNEFTFSMCVDKSLNYLNRQMSIGSPLQTVQIDFLRAGPTTSTVYYRLEFVDAFVTK
ncbi:MAG TPA: type VI secretion system tube protein Hcp, partial [Ferruginibacter sp.]|nr:type VI secretion system tube protein Hcp [Ferruginibacter sp.]